MDFKELSKLNLNEYTKERGNFTYLPWPRAVQTLLEHDPTATWDFPDPKYYGETIMVFCHVTAFGKTMKMLLPVMDYRNEAISKPDARDISDASMRCLVKCIACFGIGLYIYADESLPISDKQRPPVDFTPTSQGKVLSPIKPTVKELPGESNKVSPEIIHEYKHIRALQAELNISDSDLRAEVYELFKVDTMKTLTIDQLKKITEMFQYEKVKRAKEMGHERK